MNEKLFQVIWTHTAQQDLKRIMQFIAADSELGQRKYILLLRKRRQTFSCCHPGEGLFLS